MRGKYREREIRDAHRMEWARCHVPCFIVGEIDPICELILRETDLVAIDIGANKGFWTKALINRLNGAVRHVYMIDPSPENFRELNETTDNLIFDAEDMQIVSAYCLAAGAAQGDAVLYTNEDGSPLASLYPHKQTGRANMGVLLDETIATNVDTIDNFLLDHAVSHVDIMKIDTGGHEFDVLEGSRQSLKTGKIDLVFFEFGMHHVESRKFFADFFAFFREIDFDIYSIENHAPRLIEDYDYRYENFSTNFGFAARRKDFVQEYISEASYLAANPDVARAINDGHMASGRDHWLRHGRFEGRRRG